MTRIIGKGWFGLRFEVLQRDGFTCQYCGQSAPSVVLDVDHRLSVAEGGDDSLGNLVTACRACNVGKEALRARSEPRRARKSEAGGRTRVLEHLDVTIPQTPQAIASAMGVSGQYVRRVLAQAVEEGAVLKSTHARGRATFSFYRLAP